MTQLLRIGFAIVVGVLVTALLKWLATAVPYGVDILLGIVAAFLVYWFTPARPVV